MSLARSFSAVLILTAIAVVSIADDEADRDALRVEVEHLVETGFLRTGEVEIASTYLLAEMYERRNFSPTWNDEDQIRALITAVKAAYADGLEPSHYHLAKIESIYEKLKAGQLSSPVEWATQDLILTDSLARLCHDQFFGKVNPYTRKADWNFVRKLNGLALASVIQEANESPALSVYLQTVFPRSWFYAQYKSQLARYRQIETEGGWPQIPDGPTIQPGANDDRLPVLAKRLAITGDIDMQQLPEPITRYDDELQAAVRRFQNRHSLDSDAIVGAGTLRTLNVPVAQRIKQLRINLERARWVLDALEDDFILFNIAGFRGYVIRDRELVFETTLQVGERCREMPIFRDAMTYIVVNPTWTVPHNIATKELLPEIRKNTEYFATRDIDVSDRRGNTIDSATVAWTTLTPRNFNYTLVQRPGPGNALGRVKFMLPNAHGVYLHDTPGENVFAGAGRAFPQGCIRVENSFDFAEVLLGSQGWDQEQFAEVLDGRQTKTIFLEDPLPVLLLYWTAQVNPDGTVYFYDDVYGRDDAIAQALDKPYSPQLP